MLDLRKGRVRLGTSPFYAFRYAGRSSDSPASSGAAGMITCRLTEQNLSLGAIPQLGIYDSFTNLQLLLELLRFSLIRRPEVFPGKQPNLKSSSK
jgi:hypothetical protein